jgi:hypothetical protein
MAFGVFHLVSQSATSSGWGWLSLFHLAGTSGRVLNRSAIFKVSRWPSQNKEVSVPQ